MNGIVSDFKAESQQNLENIVCAGFGDTSLSLDPRSASYE